MSFLQGKSMPQENLLGSGVEQKWVSTLTLPMSSSRTCIKEGLWATEESRIMQREVPSPASPRTGTKFA